MGFLIFNGFLLFMGFHGFFNGFLRFWGYIIVKGFLDLLPALEFLKIKKECILVTGTTTVTNIHQDAMVTVGVLSRARPLVTCGSYLVW